LLCIGPAEPSWVNLTLRLDGEGCLEPKFHWVSSRDEALGILRTEGFDCILIAEGTRPVGGLPELSPVAVARAIRASGYDDPIVLVASRLDAAGWAEACEKECEILIAQHPWESPALVPVVKRAIRRIDLLRENHRLSITQHRRVVRERAESEHLLNQQRQLITELQALVRDDAVGEADDASMLDDARSLLGSVRRSKFALPDEVKDYYHELLRTHVIMGCGSLGAEIARLAELISEAGLSPREALEVHLERVEALVRGLGSRSARHVMARADLLALELMIHLGECYQRRAA
jgi:hypothetical protein